MIICAIFVSCGVFSHVPNAETDQGAASGGPKLTRSSERRTKVNSR